MSDFPPTMAPDGAGAQVMDAISAALAAQDLARAGELAEQAVAEGWSNPLLFNLAAYRLETARNYAAATAMLERGLQAFPNDLELLTSLGLCLNHLGRPERAVAAFDTVLQAMPDFLPAHQGKGEALERLGALEGAERHYRAAVEGMPDYADALAALALVLARTGRTDEAKPLAERALDLDPRRVGARMALSYCALSAGDAAGAEAAARAVIDDASTDPESRAIAGSALGDALDAEGRFEDAFAAYADGAAQLRALQAAGDAPAAETYDQLVERILSWLGQAGPDAWAPDAGSGDEPAAGHVFLFGGAVGSGRDPLFNILAANPQVVGAERGGLVEAEAAYLLTPDGLDRLARLSAEEGARLRQAYWRRITDVSGDLAGKVVVDRLPPGAVTVALVAALFPKAKIIAALRDPRDVVLTTVRRPSQTNPELHAFLSLEGAARLYDLSMRLLDLSGERLALEIAEVRQEDMLADPEAETRSLCAFVGVEWSPAMTEKAAEGPIGARGRYARTRWRDYAAQLTPVLPTLKPWVERFGYPEA